MLSVTEKAVEVKRVHFCSLCTIYISIFINFDEAG